MLPDHTGSGKVLVMDFKIRITRDIFLSDRTLSVVEVSTGGEWLSFGYCIEDNDKHVEEDGRRKVKGVTAIPTGIYKIRLYDSPKHGKDTPELIDVPGFQHIQIHSGNVPEDTEGCLLFGLDRDAKKNTIIKSKVACGWIRTEIIKALTAGGSVTVEIRRT